MHIPHRMQFLQHLAQTSPEPLLLEIESAQGHYLYGSSGKKYLDLISGISVSSFGHQHPHIIQAAEKQLHRHMHIMVYGELVQSAQTEFATALTSRLGALDTCYFTNSGSEAIEGAMKLAKRYTGKHGFVAQTQAYHGSTQGPLSLMSNEYFSDAYKPLLPDIVFIEQNSISDIENLPSETAAVVIELVQAEKGCYPSTVEFVHALRDWCTANRTLLIIDENQTGMGRTGTLFAFEQYEVMPDILVCGKALGGGMPLGAFLAPGHIMSVLSVQPVLGHITTFGGHPVSCATGLAALELYTHNYDVKHKEQLFRQRLVHPFIREVRGSGLLLAVELDSDSRCKNVIKKCLEYGLFTDWFLFAPQCLRIAPPLSITIDEIEQACGIILRVLNEEFI
ncbi:MAG: aspartate aminotransferase family protein [Bacteroidetes bacterium]|nr:aspartate aminotransferase family protein [Bacteroidota bacterium]